MSFPTTCWSELAVATLHGDAQGKAALMKMCEDYRGPVVAFLRYRGYPTDEVEDLTHDFFLHWFESRGWQRADPLRGRFRSYLLGALSYMLAHHEERRRAAKRGGGQKPLSLDGMEDAGLQLPDGLPAAVPDFDREWAITLIENALREVREEYAARGKMGDFEILRHYLPGSERVPGMEETAALLDLNVNAVKAAIHRLRSRFREVLRGTVARTVSAPHEIDEELIYLRTIISRIPHVSRNPEPK